MNKKLKIFLIICSYLAALFVGALFIIFINNIYHWWPKGGVFDFVVLGTYLGSIGSVGAIIAIWKTNRKQIQTQIRIQKQNVQILLASERLKVFNKYKKFIVYLISCNYSRINLIKKGEEEKQMVQNEEFVLQRIKQVFAQDYSVLTEELQNISVQISKKYGEMKKVYEYTVAHNGADGDFKDVVDQFLTNPTGFYKVESFKKVCDMCELKNTPINGIAERNHNFYQMYLEKKRSEDVFNNKYDQVIKMLEKELDIDFAPFQETK